jgi:hypothetical protein
MISRLTKMDGSVSGINAGYSSGSRVALQPGEVCPGATADIQNSAWETRSGTKRIKQRRCNFPHSHKPPKGILQAIKQLIVFDSHISSLPAPMPPLPVAPVSASVEIKVAILPLQWQSAAKIASSRTW